MEILKEVVHDGRRSKFWDLVSGHIGKQFDRSVNQVRANVKVSGHQTEAGYHAGWCDALEWVSKLPDIIAADLAKENK